MSSSAAGSEGYNRQVSSPQPQHRPSGDTASRQFLDEVLRRTAQSIDSLSAETSDPQALREVAVRYAGQPFSQPVLIELVHAGLCSQFGDLAASADRDRKMSRSIAESLYDDPAQRDRLELLWSRLSAAQ